MLMGAAGSKRREESNGRPAPRPARANGRPRTGATASVAAATVGRATMRHSFTIPSDYTASRDVQIRIMEDVENNGFDPESVFAIRIALEEALVNAIRPANRL